MRLYRSAETVTKLRKIAKTEHTRHFEMNALTFIDTIKQIKSPVYQEYFGSSQLLSWTSVAFIFKRDNFKTELVYPNRVALKV